jgi:signal peptidase I
MKDFMLRRLKRNVESTPEGSVTAPVRVKSKFRESVETVLMVIGAALLLKVFVVEAFRIPSSSMENTLLEGDFLFVNKFIYGIKTPKYLPFTDVRLPRITLPPFRQPKRGDVIVFEFPGERDELAPKERVNYIKRCIAVAGDTVLILEKAIYVNGERIAEPRHAHVEPLSSGPGREPNPRIFPRGMRFNEDNYGPIRVPKEGDLLQLTPENIDSWSVFIAREGHKVEKRGSELLIDGAPAATYRVQRNYLFMLGDNRDNSLDSRFWGFLPEENIIGQALMVYWSWNQDLPLASSDKFRSIRWARIGTIIR